MILVPFLFVNFIGFLLENKKIPLAFLAKNEKILFADTESWQSGNALDSKSSEPYKSGARVQIPYSPYIREETLIQ
ncbi:hypothetical protein TEHD23766T_1760 [Tetragenococcus halophilus subsp. flandriensis]|nr:hypothetical protein TEHD23766T_1760 [Tetragenococcus halophilus subsp. flandriensis]